MLVVSMELLLLLAKDSPGIFPTISQAGGVHLFILFFNDATAAESTSVSVILVQVERIHN